MSFTEKAYRYKMRNDKDFNRRESKRFPNIDLSEWLFKSIETKPKSNKE